MIYFYQFVEVPQKIHNYPGTPPELEWFKQCTLNTMQL